MSESASRYTPSRRRNAAFTIVPERAMGGPQPARMKRAFIRAAVLVAALIATGMTTIATGHAQERVVPVSPTYVYCDEYAYDALERWRNNGRPEDPYTNPRPMRWGPFQLVYIHGGFYMYGANCSWAQILRTRDGNPVTADMPVPGVVGDLQRNEYYAVYKDERVPTPYCIGTDADGSCTRVGFTNRLTANNDTATEGPPVGERVQGVVYTADVDHRAVRGEDGNCYREWRVNGRWNRSISYGSDDDACRKVAWNAYYRSQRRDLIGPNLPASAVPSGNPPDPDTP